MLLPTVHTAYPLRLCLLQLLAPFLPLPHPRTIGWRKVALLRLRAIRAQLRYRWQMQMIMSLRALLLNPKALRLSRQRSQYAFLLPVELLQLLRSQIGNIRCLRVPLLPRRSEVRPPRREKPAAREGRGLRVAIGLLVHGK